MGGKIRLLGTALVCIFLFSTQAWSQTVEPIVKYSGVYNTALAAELAFYNAWIAAYGKVSCGFSQLTWIDTPTQVNGYVPFSNVCGYGHVLPVVITKTVECPTATPPYMLSQDKLTCTQCPVPELREVMDIPPNGPDVLPLTRRLESTKGSDLALLPAAAEGLACLKRKTAGVFVSSGTRTVAYQAHLKEVWDTLIKLDQLEDPVEIKACKPLRDKVLAEKEGCSNNSGHCIRFQPATDSKHTIGKAFDVHTVTIDTLLLKLRPVPLLPLTLVQQQQADVKLIAGFLAKPAACSLNWGGSFGDFVHFSVP